jgi:hypothetical protein
VLTDLLGRKLNALGISYDEYLASDHWQDVRRRYQESQMPQKCLRCRSKFYELHHMTYERLGAEALTDLAPLCRFCHEKLHEFDREHPEYNSRTETLLSVMSAWTRKHRRKVFAPYHPRATKKAPKVKKQPRPPKPKKVRFGNPWERKWMSGPLGLAVKKGPVS